MYNTIFSYGMLIFPVGTSRILGGQMVTDAFLNLPELHALSEI